MKALAIIVNFFIPGLGTLIIGKVGQGIAQLILYGVGFFLAFGFMMLLVGLPICFAVWVWALIVAAKAPLQPTEVVPSQGRQQSAS